MHAFPEHRHPELEFSFCISGTYSIAIDQKIYTLQPGDLALVGSMLSHMLPENNDSNCLAITVEVGPLFLTEYFELFSKAVFHEPVVSLSADNAQYGALVSLFSELISLLQNPTNVSELVIKGDLFKICAYILSHFVTENHTRHSLKEMQNIAKIEQALELIRNRYTEQITVEQVAAMSGYSKSNFCKIFRQITGETFHTLLNRCRVENACTLLVNTTGSVESIAQQVGFIDAKSFCRVFKAAKGISPGTFRKENV